MNDFYQAESLNPLHKPHNPNAPSLADTLKKKREV